MWSREVNELKAKMETMRETCRHMEASWKEAPANNDIHKKHIIAQCAECTKAMERIQALKQERSDLTIHHQQDMELLNQQIQNQPTYLSHPQELAVLQ